MTGNASKRPVRAADPASVNPSMAADPLPRPAARRPRDVLPPSPVRPVPKSTIRYVHRRFRRHLFW